MWPTSWSRIPCDSIAVAQNAPAIKVNCPDCSAVISLDVSDTGHLRYVCQIGHAYSVEELSIAKKALGSMSTDALRARLKESEHQREALRQLLEQTHRPILGLGDIHLGDPMPDIVGGKLYA
jgi:hypothetical protein